MASNRPDLRLKQSEYVALYNRSLPTIKRWYKAGLPLDDPEAMQVYAQRGEDKKLVETERRSGRRTRFYDREIAFQDAIGAFLRQRWVLHVREFQVPNTQIRGDFLLADYAVECKINATSVLQAIGQLYIYKRTTGRTPILLVPDDVRLDQHLIEAVQSIPALCMKETEFQQMLTSEPP